MSGEDKSELENLIRKSIFLGQAHLSVTEKN